MVWRNYACQHVSAYAARHLNSHILNACKHTQSTCHDRTGMCIIITSTPTTETNPSSFDTVCLSTDTAMVVIIPHCGSRNTCRQYDAQVSHGAIQFMVYEELKALTAGAGEYAKDTGRSSLSAAQISVMGAVSKLAASVVTYPSQVLSASWHCFT